MKPLTLKNVNVGSIRDELRALWAAEALNDDAVIRARTHNMIVVVADNVSPQETTQRIIESTAERPGRVIVVDIDGDRKKPPDAWVTTYCRTVNHYQLCGEMITLTVGPSHLNDLHNAIVSLLAADLPVYLWWIGTLDTANQFVSRLAHEADRVIVNLDSFSDALVGIQTLAALARQYRVGDLAWVRLSVWRRLLAQFWDVPQTRAALNQIRTFDIHFVRGDSANPTASSLLLAGWLVKRLGWTINLVSKGPTGGYTAHYSQGKWQGKLEIVGTRIAGLASGEIAQVFIQAGEQPPFVMPRLALNPDQQSIETRWNDGAMHAPRVSNQWGRLDDAHALVEELDLGYDPEYEAALQGAMTIINGLIGS